MGTSDHVVVLTKILFWRLREESHTRTLWRWEEKLETPVHHTEKDGLRGRAERRRGPAGGETHRAASCHATSLGAQVSSDLGGSRQGREKRKPTGNRQQ